MSERWHYETEREVLDVEPNEDGTLSFGAWVKGCRCGQCFRYLEVPDEDAPAWLGQFEERGLVPWASQRWAG